jgi:transglutaminase-like putative cysteine protease
MARNIPVVFGRVLVVALALLGFAGRAVAEEYYYAVEMNGVLCGYVTFVTSPLRQDGRILTLLRHEVVIKGTLLGGAVNNRILLTYHIDPGTNAFTYHESVLEQGPTRLTSAIRIEGHTARVSDGVGGKETVVDLPADVVLDNTLFHPHLVADFVGGKAEKKTYLLFDGRDNAVRETTYTRKGTETVRLAGRSFDTVVLDGVDRRTGVVWTMWLDARTGMAVQTRQPGNVHTYLADPTVVETVNRAGSKPDLNPSVMTKANVTITNIRGITAMTVRATAQPAGYWVTPESLPVPGQRFTGTVKDNLIEGVFEIEHKRYDGTKAPPFPPDFGKDPTLRAYLEADDFIQSNDPVLIQKAREITAGSRDSWDAVRRLSQWVAANIKGAIPGGVTARGTYDERAGECGGHSFLMAAFSRSVGIPARAVSGCMYTPYEGGAFGRHAWNEVYMGEAGWIPLDTTIGETDYVDSGHIRLGIIQSVSNGLDVRAIEILDHRVSGTPVPSATAGPAKYEAYVGEYTNVARGNVVKVLERNGALALDIPGQVVLTFKEPDAGGAWRSTVSDEVFVTFDRGDSGSVVGMRLHQTVRLPRTGPPASPVDAVPADLRPYPGAYLLQQAQAQFTVVYEGQTLVINDPLAKRAIKLKPSGQSGAWIDEFGKFTIRFETDDAGKAAALLLDGVTIFRR